MLRHQCRSTLFEFGVQVNTVGGQRIVCILDSGLPGNNKWVTQYGHAGFRQVLDSSGLLGHQRRATLYELGARGSTAGGQHIECHL